MKVAVVGAGVLGAALALRLRQRGADVTLVERDHPGAGTSSRGAGLVATGLWHPTSIQLALRSVRLLAEMSLEGDGVGHPFRFHPTGSTTLVPARLAQPAVALARTQAAHGVRVRQLGPEDLAGLPRHGGMRVDDVHLALHYADDGWAMPRMYAEVCAGLALTLGARSLRGDARIERRERAVVVRAGGERLEVDAVAVASGLWTPHVLRTCALDAPIQAYRTQALRHKEARAEGLPILHDAVQGFYLRPGLPQHCVAGNGTTTTPEDPARWNAEADARFVADTRRRLLHRFPYLSADAPVEAWAGIEAATPDRLMLAGPHADDPRVWLLAGGNGHGFMRAPAAAESLAAMMLGDKPEVDLAAFDPARFSDPRAPFEIREGFSLEGSEFI